MSIGTKTGITYYSDCKDATRLTSPIIDNRVNMKVGGHFTANWDVNSLSFDDFGYGIKKTRHNQARLYSDDASRLVTMQRGHVKLSMVFENNIYSGVYYPLRNQTTFNEHILFGINVGEREVSYPSVYAALTSEGIQFRIWNSISDFSIYDNVSTINDNTSTELEFIWDYEGIDDFEFDDGYLATMLIRINGENIVVGNMPLTNDSISGLNFYLFDTPSIYSNLEMTIKEINIANEVLPTLQEELKSSSSSEE
tara:strand:- start:17737 stop:18495 length:759 start_codon:yes stop_codon:yes gene_type:complete